jgi:hypothetical protein
VRDEAVAYVDRLGRELAAVGIHGRLRARILAEAADHLADGDESAFGDPAELAHRFADDLAVDRSRRAAFTAFGSLAVAGTGFAVAWLAIAAAGFPDIASGSWPPLGVAAAIGTVVFPQVAFAAGLLALLRALRRRRAAAELALLLTRTRVALAFGALALTSLALCGLEFAVAGWILPLALVLTAPLAASAVTVRRAAVVKSSVPGEAGDVFDDLPVALPRRPGLLLAATAVAAAVATLVAAPNHEGIRNAVVEVVLVLGGWLALGRRLGLRR